MPAIDTLHRTAQNRDPDDVQRAKHFVHNETKKDRKDRDEQKLKQARNIIERYHEYRNRIQRLHAAFSALGEVFVLYHVYVDLGNGAKVLLVKGIDDP